MEWDIIGAALVGMFPKNDVVAQPITPKEFLVGVVPLSAENQGRFVGTFVYNVFIVLYPYGWTKGSNGKYSFSWPPTGFEQLRQMYQDNVEKFASVLSVFYIDLYTAGQYAEANPGSDLVAMLSRTGFEIEQMCGSTDGMSFGGYLESPITETFFQESAANHFANQPYLRP